MNAHPKLELFFVRSAGVLLAVAGSAKLLSSFGSARILQVFDPVIGIKFQHLFWIVGSLEIATASFCMFSRRSFAQAGCVAWMVANFIMYRFGLVLIDYDKPCKCLGNLTDALHISPETADTAMKVVLFYLGIGSGLILFSFCARRAERGAPPLRTEVSTSA